MQPERRASAPLGPGPGLALGLARSPDAPLAAHAARAAILHTTATLAKPLALSDRLQAILRGRLSSGISTKDTDSRRLSLMMAVNWGGDHAA